MESVEKQILAKYKYYLASNTNLPSGLEITCVETRRGCIVVSISTGLEIAEKILHL